MKVTCQACGSKSQTTDYCDSCGVRLVSVQPNSARVAVDLTCPNCGAPRVLGGVFCEDCGLDFATGNVPAVPQHVTPAPAATPAPTPAVAYSIVVDVEPTGWSAEAALRDDPTAAAPGPTTVALTESEVIIGRSTSTSVVQIDVRELTGDPAVSRRHARLIRNTDGGYDAEDLGSANGTTLNGATLSSRQSCPPDSILAVGAWTRLRMRKH